MAPPTPGLAERYDVLETVEYILKGGYRSVALQFPDEQLADSPAVSQLLQQELGDRAKVFILADTAYNPLGVDEVAAQHLAAQCVIHYGRASLVPANSLPAFFVLPKEPLDVPATASVVRQAVDEAVQARWAAAAVEGTNGGAGASGYGGSSSDQRGFRAVVLLVDQGYQYQLRELSRAIGSEAGGGCGQTGPRPPYIFASVPTRSLTPATARPAAVAAACAAADDDGAAAAAASESSLPGGAGAGGCCMAAPAGSACVGGDVSAGARSGADAGATAAAPTCGGAGCVPQSPTGGEGGRGCGSAAAQGPNCSSGEPDTSAGGGCCRAGAAGGAGESEQQQQQQQQRQDQQQQQHPGQQSQPATAPGQPEGPRDGACTTCTTCDRRPLTAGGDGPGPAATTGPEGSTEGAGRPGAYLEAAAGDGSGGAQGEVEREGCSAASTNTTSMAGLTWTLPPGVGRPDCLYVWVGPAGSSAQQVLQLTHSTCEWLSYDPAQEGGGGGAVRQGLSDDTRRLLKRRNFVLEKARAANIVGLLVGTLGSAGFLDVISALRRMAAAAGKKSYTFLMGKPNPAKLGNFPEVDVFVMVADAQGLILDSRDYLAPMVTPWEAALAWSGRHIDLEDYRLELRDVLAFEELRRQQQQQADGGDEGTTMALQALGHLGLSVASRGSANSRHEIVARSAAEYLALKRSYKGLEMPATGASPKAAELAVEGRGGRAAGYEGEDPAGSGAGPAW